MTIALNFKNGEIKRKIHLDGKIYNLVSDIQYPAKNCSKDVLFLLAGENKELRFRSEKAIELYNRGNVGCIFVSGAEYDGFATKEIVKKGIDAEGIANYLNIREIPSNKIFLDNRSLDTIGNFAFPFADPLKENEFIKDVDSILLVTEKNHLERAIENSLNVISPYNLFYVASEGDYNPSFLIKTYESAIKKALRNIKEPSPEKVLKFLKEKHPFYQEEWFDKPIIERKYEVGKNIIKWLAGYNKAD